MGHCWLHLDDLHEAGFDGKALRMRDQKGNRTYERSVLRYDGRGETVWKEEYARQHDVALCDEELSEVCPFRVHSPRGPYERKNGPLVDCKLCGQRHYKGSPAHKYCKNYYKALGIFEEMAKYDERWAVQGSREDPFKEKLSPYWQQAFWDRIRYLVMERDNYTCQICGTSGKAVGYSDERSSSFVISYKIGDSDYDWETKESTFRLLKPGEYGYRHPDKYMGMQVHHIIPREEKGGSDHPRNLMTVCEECHWKLTGEQHRKRWEGVFTKRIAKKRKNRHLEECDDRGTSTRTKDDVGAD